MLLDRLLAHVEFLPSEAVEVHHEAAVEALGHVDPDDVIFLATALAAKAESGATTRT